MITRGLFMGAVILGAACFTPAAAESAPPPPPPLPDQSRPVSPIGEAAWMNRVAASYPARALAAQMEGKVTVSLIVNPEGRVSACRVTQSSGESVLDKAACAAFERHARFNPALDSRGAATTGRYSTSVAYKLP